MLFLSNTHVGKNTLTIVSTKNIATGIAVIGKGFLLLQTLAAFIISVGLIKLIYI